MWVGHQKRLLRGCSVLGHSIGFWRPETLSFPGESYPLPILFQPVIVAGQARLGVPLFFEPSFIGEYRRAKAGAKNWGQSLSDQNPWRLLKESFLRSTGPLHNPIPLWLSGGIFLYKNISNVDCSVTGIIVDPQFLLVTLSVDDCCSRLLDFWTKKNGPLTIYFCLLALLEQTHTHSVGWLPYSRNGLWQPRGKPSGCLSQP